MRFSKYGARKTTVDGITFDSRAEAARWLELKQLSFNGTVSEVCRQTSFELIPGEEGPDGRKLRNIRYVADFTYKDSDGNLHVEDVKGFRTDVYRLKKRLMWHILGINVEEVSPKR